MMHQRRIPVRLEYELWPGTLGPLPETPRRRARSVRRTTSIRCTWPTGFDGALVVACTGRDLATDARHATRSVAGATATLTTEPGTRIVAAVDDALLAPLVGADLVRGFRKADAALTEPGSLLALLLDDAPGIVGVSSSSPMRAAVEQTGSLRFSDAYFPLPAVCIGRAGSAMSRAQRRGRPLLGQGPPCRRLERDDDESAWHDKPSLPLSRRGAQRAGRRRYSTGRPPCDGTRATP